MFDPLRLAIALLPIAAYANVLGLLRLRSVPTVVSGASDFVLLGMAAMGMIAIGPMELFFPRAAFSLLGGWIWIVLLALYFFVLLLIALNLAPRLIVYGLDASQLKQLILELLKEESISSDWLGDVVHIPEMGIRAHIEPASRASVSQLQATGKDQNLNGWFTLERLLVKKVSSLSTSQPRLAMLWLLSSFVLFGLGAWLISADLPRLKQAISMLFGGD